MGNEAVCQNGGYCVLYKLGCEGMMYQTTFIDPNKNAYFKLFEQALERGYRVDFCEPDTSWKFDPYELEKYDYSGIIQIPKKFEHCFKTKYDHLLLHLDM